MCNVQSKRERKVYAGNERTDREMYSLRHSVTEIKEPNCHVLYRLRKGEGYFVSECFEQHPSMSFPGKPKKE